jgi:hypothetical protein
LRPYGYRYYKLRVKASSPGAQVRFSLGQNRVSFHQRPLYGWEVTVDAADTWEEHEIDLAYPTLVNNDWATSDTPAWIATDAQVNPSFWLVDPELTDTAVKDGATVFVELLTASVTYTLDRLQGFVKTDGDRLPLLIFFPLSGRGELESIYNYDDQAAISQAFADMPYQLLKVLTNGAQGIRLTTEHIVTSGGPHHEEPSWSVWIDKVISKLHHGFVQTDGRINDSGITVTKYPDDLLDLGALTNGALFHAAGEFGRDMFPDTPFRLRGQGRYANAADFNIAGPLIFHPGAGDIGGADGFSPTVKFRLEWVVDGEVTLLVSQDSAPAPDVAIELRDNDSGASVYSGATNDDGLVRLFQKYGVFLPFKNLPAEATSTSTYRANHILYSSGPVYTPTGLLFNSYWLFGERLRDVDSAGYASEFGGRLPLTILDRHPMFYAARVLALADGLDLAETTNGWKFLAYRSGSNILVRRSRDRGTSWDAAQVLATDAASDAVPSLAVDAQDTLYCWYHTAAPVAKGVASADHGERWDTYGSLTAYKFPRLAILADRQLLAVFNGDDLDIYETQEYAATAGGLTLAVTFGVQPLQRVLLVPDRHGTAHLIYQNAGGDLLHRPSDDPAHLGSWADVSTLVASADFPALALGIVNGLLVWFEGAALHAGVLTSDYSAIDHAAGVPAGTFAAGYPGLVYDAAGDAYLFAGQAAGGGVQIAGTPHEGADWTALP